MDKIEKFVRSKLPSNFVNKHIRHVAEEALWLARFYPKADKEVVRVGAWLHDVTHPLGGYNRGDHNIASAKTAGKFLKSINFEERKLKKVIHCIEAHRTSRPPEPRTIEAKIVASADNLVHFTMFDYLQGEMGLKYAAAKIRRDLAAKFMIPPAMKKAKKLAAKIEKKYRIKI